MDNLILAEDFEGGDNPTLELFCKGKGIGEIVEYRSHDEVIKEIEEILKIREVTGKLTT